MTVPVSRILALLQAGDFTAAAALADDAIASGAVHPLLFDVRGHRAMQAGRYEAALADFTRAESLAPGNPALAHSAARCLINLDRWPDAIAACDRAIAIAPGFAPAHYEKGCTAEMLGDLVLAGQCYDRATKLEPRMAPAFARLGALAARRGQWTEARAFAGTALAHEPDNAIALFTLARAGLAENRLDGVEESLAGIAGSTPDPQTQATALSLMGDVFDRQDRTGEAFDAYSAANAVLAEAYAPRFAGLESGLDRVTRLKREFADCPAGAWTKRSTEARSGHVFILGFYRTGTTLLGQILASHPAMVTLEEKPVLIDAAEDFLDRPGGLSRLAAMDDGQAERYRAKYWQRVRALEPQAEGKIVVDKLPLNSTALAVIARLFPEAKILFALRDPRDVVFSCFRRLLNVNRDTYEMLDPERGARFYAAVMALADDARATLPLNILDVRNEELAADFEPVVRRICTFLGIPWNDQMAQFAEQSRDRAIATPSAAQVARGLNSDGIGQWRRYAAQLLQPREILAPWVWRFGYDRD